MEFTLKNFITSGAVKHICYYAATECGIPVDWDKVAEYVQREFRDATQEQRQDLLGYCYRSYCEAQKLNMEIPN